MVNELDQTTVIAARRISAVACGAILGVDRDIHGKPAGLRVLSLVSLGGAIITMASQTLAIHWNASAIDATSRTIQGLLAGIGFLGAGVILRERNEEHVHGMTTSASIWLSSIMGMVCGLGQWRLALVSFVLALLMLLVGRRIEKAIIRWAQSRDDDHPSPIRSTPASDVRGAANSGDPSQE